MENTEYGFSLFELLIVLVIIGILAKISYPIYTHILIRTHRTEAKIALINLAQHMEIYYLTNNNSYEFANFNKLHSKDMTEKKFYDLALKSTANTYLLSAKAKFSDPECYLFMLNQLGKKTNAGSGSNLCW
ncbi:type IV pilin protein [Rickettsiella endosymbiont of Miltochrista miniata]|uniref:type IV pilin protein n=1 Tax=Rickettsiella endosymbiont of Miltochrista miniata TaxID=3066239 RepID=UPI00313DA892